MRTTPAVGMAMILGAALLGAVLAVAMYQVEVANRARLVSAAAPPTSQAAASTSPAAAAPAATPIAEAANAAGATGGAGDVAAGEKLFAATCNVCHPNANAGMGLALRGPQFAAKYPEDASLKQIMRRGSGSMPPYPSASLSDGDLEAVVAYLRSLK